jgi:predicted hydrocarbon binding protein
MIETKCIGLGDPYCEVKIVPYEIDELKHTLTAIDTSIIDRIHNSLLDRLTGYLLHDKPLWKERPRLGDSVGLHAFSYSIQVPAIYSERYRNAMRLGGVLSGKRLGKILLEYGIDEDEAVNKVIDLIDYCKVGRLSLGKTLRMEESCESFTVKAEVPYCFFTTGFLKGFFEVVKDQSIVEKKCIAIRDPYWEWEFKKTA